MSAYILRRLLQSIPLILVISVIIFLLIQMTPGGPLAIGESIGTGRVTPEQLERLRARYGLDQPLILRYFYWLRDFLRGDWGTSFNTGRPVLEMILERLPTTLLLTGLAYGVMLVLSFPIGIYSSVRQYSFFDYVLTSLAFIGISIPSFWFGLLLLYLFSFQTSLLPAFGLNDVTQEFTGFARLWDMARHLIMPVSVLALIDTAAVTRYIRASMLDTIHQDYVRTARAKGLWERRVILKHVLRNATIPIVTILALRIPDLFLGTVVTETIFSIPGMGRLFIMSADLRDYPVLMGILVIASVLVIFSNLLADLLYAVLDPRIRVS
ncbi:MAG: ABC transporter permease [Anaerolineales bacterium]|jgi:peptide/nickel transport system permease protein|nr:ABC transporter permease [Anaerolineales bacterium]